MSGEAVIEVRDVTRTFMISSGFMKPKRPLHAVNGVNLRVDPGAVVARAGGRRASSPAAKVPDGPAAADN